MQTTTQTEAKATQALANADKAVTKLVLMDKDAIKAGQDVIRTSIMALDMAVHANAVQCLMHAEKHGDTSLMARLLNEVLDDKTGYNRRGLIRWMRMFSPLELSGKKITLTGLDDDGKRRPFLLEKANATPFYLSKDLNQQGDVKPIFQDTLLSKFDTMVKEFEAAMSNTQDGKAIDPKKPFYDGINQAQILNFVTEGKKMRDGIKDDATREVWLANQKLKEAQALQKADKAAA